MMRVLFTAHLQAAFDKYDPEHVGSDEPELTDQHENDYCVS